MHRFLKAGWSLLIVAVLVTGPALSRAAAVTPTPTRAASADDAAEFTRLLNETRTRPIVFGPSKGDLALSADTVAVAPAGVNLQDFAAHVQFRNPYPATQHAFDYGIEFRSQPDTHYRLGIVSSGNWFFSLGAKTLLQSGKVAGLDVSAGGGNRFDVIAIADKAYFGVNGKYLATLDVSANVKSGDLAIATSFLADSFIAGASTGYKDFIIWSLDANAPPGVSPTVKPSPTPRRGSTPAATVVPTKAATVTPAPTRTGPAATETPGGSPAAAGSYTSPTYGYRLSWDGSWSVVDQTSSQGFDYLRLTNGTSFLDLSGFPSTTDPKTCVDAEFNHFQKDPGYSKAVIAQDQQSKPLRADSPTFAFAVIDFTYTQNGQATNYSAYIDCRPIEPNKSMLRVDQFVPASKYNDQIQARVAILDTLTLATAPGQTPSTEPTAVATVERVPTTPSGPATQGAVGVKLAEEGGSGVSGLATLTSAGDKTGVKILSIGAQTGAVALIHKGTCATLDPAPAFLLHELDASGASDTTISVSLADLRAGGYAIAIHAGIEDLTHPIACGEIPSGG